MEIYKTTFNGTSICVVFNGGCYLFYNTCYGFLAFAVRSKLAQEDKHDFFTLTCGNHHCLGGALTASSLESKVKAFIRKTERAHGALFIDFETHEKDLANAWLDLESAFKIRD